MTGTLVACDGIGCPVLEEAQHFLLTVALTFFQETRILYVKHPTLSIHDDEDSPDPRGETKDTAQGIAEHVAAAIAAGRCRVTEGSAAALPFGESSFDMVTAFETVYFWPKIEECFRGVRRTLKEGGRFLIVNEDDGLTGNNEKWEKMIEGMHTYTPDELRAHLSAAGFSDITVHLESQRHWLTVIATK